MGKNILVVNFGGIGDEILFLPALISLKKEFPESKITLALEPRSAGIKDLTDVVDEVFPCGKRFSGQLKLVLFARRGRFDMVISSGGNKLIAALLRLMDIKERYGYDTGLLSRLLLTKAVPLNKNQYAAAMYHDLAAPVTTQRTLLPEINVLRGEPIPNSVLFHPGVSRISVEKGMIKTVSGEVWAEIIKLLRVRGKKVMLVGGPDDEEVIKEILRLVPQSDILYKTKSLRELAELIGRAEKFVCSDSAPLHIAVAMGTPTYAIFGPTDAQKLIPAGVTALRVKHNCPLNPCLWERRQTTCRRLGCLKFNPQEVVDTILK